MKRLAIFAGFDKDSIIDDYVIFYLKELKKVADIIFVYDTEFSDTELAKVKDLTIHQICKKHGEYDFGSYKRGYIYAKENNLLEQYEELIFCNDSVYGPFSDLGEMFKKMDKHNCDFWGPFVFNFGKGKKHVQSFFIVYKKNVFMSKVFDDFVMSITKQESKGNIVKAYEIGGSQYLYKHGFKFKGLFESYINETHYKQAFSLIKKGMPFLKINIFKQSSINNVIPLPKTLNGKSIDVMILNHLNRVISKEDMEVIRKLKYHKIHQDILFRKFIKVRARYIKSFHYKITISFIGIALIVIVLPKFIAIRKR